MKIIQGSKDWVNRLKNKAYATLKAGWVKTRVRATRLHQWTRSRLKATWAWTCSSAKKFGKWAHAKAKVIWTWVRAWLARKKPAPVRKTGKQKWLSTLVGMGIVGTVLYMLTTTFLIPQDVNLGEWWYALPIIIVGGAVIAAWQHVMSKRSASWIVAVVVLFFFASNLWELKNPAVTWAVEMWRAWSFASFFTFFKAENIAEMATATRLQVLFWLAVVTVICWTFHRIKTESAIKGGWALTILVMFILPLGIWIEKGPSPGNNTGASVQCRLSTETASCYPGTEWSQEVSTTLASMQLCSTARHVERGERNGTSFVRFKADRADEEIKSKLVPVGQDCPATL